MVNRNSGSKRILALFLSFLMILSLLPATLFAGEGDENYSKKKIEVSFTLSHDDGFVIPAKHDGVSNMPIVNETIKLKYFDLANYDLQKFYFKSSSYKPGEDLSSTPEQARNHITMLHLYIYVAEVYYLGVSPENAGQGALKEYLGTDLLKISGSAGSMFLEKVFNFDYNLNYYLNYAFPTASSGWGSTADQIELHDGDEVQMGHFSSMNFHGDKNSGFHQVACKGNADAGEKLRVEVSRYWGTDTTTKRHETNIPELYVIKKENLNEENPAACTAEMKLKRQAEGGYIFDTSGLATGTYYLAVPGQYGESGSYVVSTPAAATVTVKGSDNPPPKPQEEKIPVEIKGIHSAQINSAKLYTYKDGVKGEKNLLEGVATKPDDYASKYETELPEGDYWLEGYGADGHLNGGIKVSFTKKQNSVTVHRIWDFCVENDGWKENVDYKLAIKVTGKDGTLRNIKTGSLDGDKISFLYLDEDKIEATFTPIGERAKTHTAVTEVKTSRDTTSNIDIRVTIPEVGALTINAPKGSTISAGFGNSRNYYKYTFVEPQVTESEEGVTAKFDMPKEQSKCFYRVQNPDGVTYWAFPGSFDKTKSINVTKEDLHIGDESFKKNSAIRFNKNVYDMANVYMNINNKGFLEMKEGGRYSLNCVRNWQPIESYMNGKIAIPDFKYEVIDEKGNSSDVVTVTADKNNSAVADIKANHSGTAIVLVKYDAMSHTDAMGGKEFSAIWPELTGVFVVTVGDKDSSIETGMTLNRGKNVSAIDAEHDTLYYIDGEEGASYSFTPESGSQVSVNRAVVTDVLRFNGFSKDGVEIAENGEVTVKNLKNGRHIIKVEKDGKVTYQVVNTRPLKYEIQDAKGKKIEDISKIKAGTEIRIQFSGLLNPAEKLAGVYNRKTNIAYKDKAGKSYTSNPGGSFGVYDFSGNPERQCLNLTIPENFEDSELKLIGGALESNGFGSAVGEHRKLTYETGLNPNLNADTVSGTLGRLPDISIPVSGKTPVKTEVKFTGNGAADVEGENPKYANPGEKLSFKINKAEYFKYEVSVDDKKLEANSEGIYEIAGEKISDKPISVTVDKNFDKEAVDKKVEELEKAKEAAEAAKKAAEELAKELKKKLEEAQNNNQAVKRVYGEDRYATSLKTADAFKSALNIDKFE
ncbi:MAG: hypothetical protein SPI74_07850, partial [Eubacterium sp.]|nr:hypothetical protein [Eubacterium sp.]